VEAKARLVQDLVSIKREGTVLRAVLLGLPGIKNRDRLKELLGHNSYWLDPVGKGSNTVLKLMISYKHESFRKIHWTLSFRY